MYNLKITKNALLEILERSELLGLDSNPLILIGLRKRGNEQIGEWAIPEDEHCIKNTFKWGIFEITVSILVREDRCQLSFRNDIDNDGKYYSGSIPVDIKSWDNMQQFAVDKLKLWINGWVEQLKQKRKDE